MGKKYSVILVSVAFVACAAVGVFNYKIDPYLLFGFEAADSARLSRIDQFNHMRVTKPWYLREVKPTAVIVGSSRSARVNPQHSAWENNVVYNMAAPGMTVTEILRFIQHAHAIEPLEKLMIGLDFEAFIRATPLTRPGFEESRMARNHQELSSVASGVQYFSDVMDSLFSIPALSRSLAAATGISPPGRRYSKNGTWETTTTLLTGYSGYEYVGGNVVLAAKAKNFDAEANLKVFAEVLAFCHQNNIETRLFFTPTHVFFVDLWQRLGYESMWRNFHLEVEAINRQAALDSGSEAFPLWGFSAAKGIVDEPIYRGKAATRAWYDDGVHTRVRLGKKMMNDVWGDKAEIGLRLTANNIAAYLVETMRLLNNFTAESSALVDKLHSDIGLQSNIE